jgi:diguanylate cyclase (GGDEF)-like protein
VGNSQKKKYGGFMRVAKRNLKIAVWLIGVVVFAMVLEIIILNSFNKKSLNKTSVVLLNQVVNILEENEKSENDLIATLKEDYIVRAQAVSYIIDSKPSAEYDVSELRKIAEMMQIDEIHLFNEAGEIYSGSEPKYYGYNFDSGEQMAYFKPMLTDKSLTMCQDVTPNTAEGKSMMYAITWSDAGDRMIQVGIEPLRLLEELRKNEISKVIADMPAYDGVNILVAYADTGEVCGSTDSSLLGMSLDEIGISQTDSRLIINGYVSYCNSKTTGEYIVFTTYSTSESVKNFVIALVVEFLYLLLAGLIIIYMFKNVIRANGEKEAQMEVLVSISDIFNSMHLIDLKKNTVTEYSARDEVTEVVNRSTSASEMMINAMTLTTEDDYREVALEFTDINTIADRMRNKKIISEEFRSKAIGWYVASFITIEQDEKGRPTKLIYVTRSIEKEKKKEAELVYKSNIDELTGLLNRRAYEDNIAEYNDTVNEDDFVFVSLDVNGLKTVNDTKGHVAGDELLIGAASCMKQSFGAYGRIYRTGGDEFAAIIFANMEQLERIKQDFEEITSKWSGKLIDSISVSCGYVIAKDEDTTSVHELANIADKRMYEVKARHYGRV